jgi:hypothetical protein
MGHDRAALGPASSANITVDLHPQRAQFGVGEVEQMERYDPWRVSPDGGSNTIRLLGSDSSLNRVTITT